MGPIDYNQRLPSHYCDHCSHVVFEDDEACPDCGNVRPDDGWDAIQDGFDPWLGRLLDGRYVVTQRIGRGSMGSVYRARSMAISREFAVKMINFKEGASGLDAEQVRARLHREIEAIGRLRNPHIVPFYEVLELFDDFVGVVMDYVEGSTLEELVYNGGALEPVRAARVLRQIANGVHEAHLHGMIHRDLKPDNIMIEVMPAGDDFAHVLDFGIVQMDDGVKLTKGFLGTPLYASPEQAMAGDVDLRSDIYSLGVLFFFMLTGRPPFESDNVYDILQSHVRTPPPKLSDVLDYDLPSAFEELISTMLEKSPDKRPDDLSAVIKQLDELVRGGPVLVPDSAPDSLEMVFEPGAITQSSEGYDTDIPGLGEDSSSVFESTEHDRTGPKAAIFSRGRARSGIRRAIAQSRDDKPKFDRIYQGQTGAHTLGVAVKLSTALGAASSEGSLVLANASGDIVRVDGTEVTALARIDQLSALAINTGVVLTGTRDGEVARLAGTERAALFNDHERAPIAGLAAAPEDRLWLAATASGAVYRCRPAAGHHVWKRIQGGPPAGAVAVSNAADMFAVARRNGEAEITSLGRIETPFVRFPIRTDGVRHLAFSADGHLIAILYDDDSVTIHLVQSGQRVHSLADRRHHIFAISFREQTLIGYFQLDGKLYARQMDRSLVSETLH